MRLFALAAGAAAALVASCSRDFALPTQQPLSLSPAFSAVAPREKVTLVAAGGAGGYAWRFAEGGALSGGAALLDPGTGAYQAGERGSAQDLVEVFDRTGGHASARISVGPRLTISPAQASTAPRGRLSFVAAGGRPPYSFMVGTRVVTPTGSSGDTVEYVAQDTVYDLAESLVVRDATGDPLALATATINVGSRLRVLPQQPSVAPYEAVAFVAMGGQPPYTWSIPAGAGQPVMSPASTIDETGRYLAGGGGQSEGQETVRVRDANGNQDETQVKVGASLRLSLSSAALRPGVPAQLVATGGRPPYRFTFSPRGNRSGGAVDAESGLYTPGPSYLAVDLLEASDELGLATARLEQPLPVGPTQLSVGSGVRRCLAADLDGDRGDDAVFLFSAGRLSTALRLGSTAPEVQSYSLGWSSEYFPSVFPLSLDGNHLTDLAFVGAAGRSSPASGAWAFLAQLGGRLSPGPAFPAPDRIGAAARLPAAASSSGVAFLTDAPCDTSTPNPSGALDGLRQLDWSPISGWSAGACLPAPYVHFSLPAAAMAVFDWDGDGYQDLAWLPGILNQNGPLMIHRGVASGGFGEATLVNLVVPLPAGTFSLRFDHSGDGAQDRFVGASEGVLMRLGYGNPQRNLVLLYDVKNARWRNLDPSAAGAPTLQGFAQLVPSPGGEETYVSWDGASGKVNGFTVTESGELVQVLPPPLAGDLPFAVGCIALPDVDADGLPDLVAAGEATSFAQVVYGEGDGRFGVRPRWFGIGAPLAGGDLDGDGAGDLVVSQDGLVVLYGGEGQLSRGQRLTGSAVRAVATPKACNSARARAIIYQEASGSFLAVPTNGDGTFGAPAPFVVTEGGVGLFTQPLPYLEPARLAGNNGCEDLLSSRVDGFGRSIAVRILVWGPNAGETVLANVLPPFAEPIAKSCTYLAVGKADGSPGRALVGACVVQADPLVPGSPFTRISLWGLAGFGLLDAWVPLGTKLAVGNPVGTAAQEVSVVRAGTLANGKPVFVAGVDGTLWTVVINAPDTSSAAGWTLGWTAHAAAGLFQPGAAILGDLRGGAGRRDLVVSGLPGVGIPGGTVVLTGDGAGTFTFLQLLPIVAPPALILPLTKGGLADVIAVPGLGGNLGLPGELVLLRNQGDGSGRIY